MNLQSFRGEWRVDWHDVREVKQDIEDFCAALVRINLRKLATYRIPLLYQSGVRYHQEHAEDAFQDCLSTYRRGFGDCDDLACWRAAELRKQGSEARVEVQFLSIEPNDSGSPDFSFHAFVRRANGSIEDPTLLVPSLR